MSIIPSFKDHLALRRHVLSLIRHRLSEVAPSYRKSLPRLSSAKSERFIPQASGLASLAYLRIPASSVEAIASDEYDALEGRFGPMLLANAPDLAYTALDTTAVVKVLRSPGNWSHRIKVLDVRKPGSTRWPFADYCSVGIDPRTSRLENFSSREHTSAPSTLF